MTISHVRKNMTKHFSIPMNLILDPLAIGLMYLLASIASGWRFNVDLATSYRTPPTLNFTVSVDMIDIRVGGYGETIADC